MEFLKRSWAQMAAQLERLSFAERAAIVLGVVVLIGAFGMAMYLVAQPRRIAVPYAAGRLDEGVAMLHRYDIDAEVRNGQLVVPVSAQYDALARLTEYDMLNHNSAEAFAQLVEHSPWDTDAQVRKKYVTALQSYLSNVTGRIKGVRSASVIISIPENKGFGTAKATPSASVMVDLEGSRTKIDGEMVEALASLVAGAVAEMTPQDVEIVDSRGRHYKVGDPDEQLPTEARELVRSEENYHRNKIVDYLRIEGALVAVSVNTSQVRREVVEQTEYMEREPVRSELSQESSFRETSDSGEAGVRPNTGADINAGATAGSERTESTTQTEFGDKKPTSHIRREMAGHQIEQINVTVNVPRSYFLNIYQAQNPEGEAPDDAALQPIITAELASIETKVQPLITTGKQPGQVKASMYYDPQYLSPGTDGSGADGVAALVTGPMGGTLAVGALALLAVGLMFYLVRRTTQEESMPTVEELAGVPQSLPSDDDLVGEAEEVENTLAGVELDEDSLRSRKIAEQISDMIKASPQEAGSLLGKWVTTDD